jgi:hypothetical protein
LRRLIALDQTTGPGFALLGLCEFETKEYAKALNHIYQARRIGLGDDPQVRRVVLFHEMLLLIRLQEYESAMQVLMSVVKEGGAGPAVVEAAGLAGLRRPIFPEELPPGDKDLIESAGRAVCAMAQRDPRIGTDVLRGAGGRLSEGAQRPLSLWIVPVGGPIRMRACANIGKNWS